MSRVIDEKGNTYGVLRVLEETATPPGERGAHWLCLCTCGEVVVVRGASLRAGTVKSCGCLHGLSLTEYEIGKRYGKLQVMERARSQGDGARWICLCDCGKTISATGQHLRTGNLTSCGHC
jgi:hypothetical protein